MVDVARARKLAVRIREVVATTLELQVKDPRLGMVTITDAKVTPDLREATLYYTVYGDDARAAASSATALESAKGVLRTQVGRQTGVRYTPSLAFVADVVPETTGRHRGRCSTRPGSSDARVQEIAVGRAARRRRRPLPRAAGRGRTRTRTRTTADEADGAR